MSAPPLAPSNPGSFWQNTCRTVGRFPVATVACGMLTVGVGIEEWTAPLLYFALVTFFWDLAVRLVAERHRLGASVALPVSILGAAGAAALGATLPQHGADAWLLPVAAGMAAVAAAGRLDRKGDHDFWIINAVSWGGCATGLIVAAIVGGGISLLFVGAGQLFGLSGAPELLALVAVACLCFVWPLHALSGVPTIDGATVPPVPRIVRVLAAILVPIALAALALIHLHAVQMIVTGTLPGHQTAWLVALFGACGLLAWVIALEPSEREPGYQRWFRTWFPPLLALPTLLQIAALAVRVTHYGWTPARLLLALLTVWLGAWVGWWLIRRRWDLGVAAMPALLALLLAAAAVGPSSLSAMAARDQTARLATLLQDVGVLHGGRRIHNPPSLAPATEERVVDLLRLLVEWQRLDGIAAWFEPPVPWASSAADPPTLATVAAAFGIRNTERTKLNTYVTVRAPTGTWVPATMPAGRLMMREWFGRSGEDSTLPIVLADQPAVRLDQTTLTLTADLGGTAPARLDLLAIIGLTAEDLRTRSDWDLPIVPRGRLDGPAGTLDVVLQSLSVSWYQDRQAVAMIHLLLIWQGGAS